MSLPVIKALADCTDASKTVLPYLPQLYNLPQQIFQNINSLQTLKVLYISTNPLITALALSLFLAPIFLIVSEVNRNYSQVDRCWSILPTVYNAHYVLYAHAAGLPTRRLDTLLIFSGIWSVGHAIVNQMIEVLIATGSIDLQLLAERRLQHRLRRLSLGSPQATYQSSTILCFQCRLHLTPTKRKVPRPAS